MEVQLRALVEDAFVYLASSKLANPVHTSQPFAQAIFANTHPSGLGLQAIRCHTRPYVLQLFV